MEDLDINDPDISPKDRAINIMTLIEIRFQQGDLLYNARHIAKLLRNGNYTTQIRSLPQDHYAIFTTINFAGRHCDTLFLTITGVEMYLKEKRTNAAQYFRQEILPLMITTHQKILNMDLFDEEMSKITAKQKHYCRCDLCDGGAKFHTLIGDITPPPYVWPENITL